MLKEHAGFRDLQKRSSAYGKQLHGCIPERWRFESPSSPLRTLALLSPSSIEFALAWLGLIRLGYSVLLIA